MSNARIGLASRFDALSRRERGVILGAGILAIGLLGWFYAIEPQRAKEKRATQSLQAVRINIAQLRQQNTELTRTLAQDLNAELRARIALLEKKVAQLDENLRNLQRGLVPPQKMTAMLEDMLDQNQRLRLLSLRTLPVSPLIEDRKPAGDTTAKAPGVAPKTAEAASSAQRIFKHGVELTVQGSYHDLLEYVAQLERLSVQMFWAESGMDAKDYPRVKLKLTLFTLSLDETWLVL